jgi:5'-methylthioadenosine phosphorylase
MKIGIIGGSGMDDPELIKDYEERAVETKFGNPSSKIVCGSIGGVDVCILSRHGRKHEIAPSQVNYRANIAALKILGCTHILATSAVGSLKEEIKPSDFIFLDQFIDFTKKRESTFYDMEGEVKHEEMAEPFSGFLRKILIETSRDLGLRKHDRGTIVVIEGPRFSTRAESFMFRNIADVIGMTTVPECVLAKEAGMEYASIAMSTDYDCWKKDEESVTFDMVMRRMADNADRVKKLIIEVIPKIRNFEENGREIEYIRSKIRMIPNYPKPGIMFRDLTTLLKDGEGMKKVMGIFYNRYKEMRIDVVAGVESRGFIIGGILAEKLGCGFVPIRKKGKLPGDVEREDYTLEYGTDTIEIHSDAIQEGQRVLMVDDLIATGGTMGASCNLVEKLRGKIVECAFIIELSDLKGRERIAKYPIFKILEFEGD